MHKHELTLVADDVTGTAVADPKTLYVPPTPAQFRRKPIAPEEIELVLKNRPMPRVPRSHEKLEDSKEVTKRLLARIFPQFDALYDEDKGKESFRNFDRAVADSVAEHKKLGMNAQAKSMEQQAATYRVLRSILVSEEDFLRPDSIIPLEYLPDLFMAVPVWYRWPKAGSNSGGMYPSHVREIANMVPGQRWHDTFAMFNYRDRILAEYEGDVIPPKIFDRMKAMGPVCEHLFILTPYHDKAGMDWNQLAWQRSVDPYVVGFLKNVPFLIVLGRFSDSGTFPLYSEMVADTMNFLRTNKQRLAGFNKSDGLRWEISSESSFGSWRSDVGRRLIAHTDQMLAAYDRGELFDWLRGVEPKKA